jgi:hypothetical protein
MIALALRHRVFPLVAGGVAAGLALTLLLGASRGRPISPSVLPLMMVFALAALTGIAKTTTV